VGGGENASMVVFQNWDCLFLCWWERREQGARLTSTTAGLVCKFDSKKPPNSYTSTMTIKAILDIILCFTDE
jgi:hypothetical protein